MTAEPCGCRYERTDTDAQGWAGMTVRRVVTCLLHARPEPLRRTPAREGSDAALAGLAALLAGRRP